SALPPQARAQLPLRGHIISALRDNGCTEPADTCSAEHEIAANKVQELPQLG
ncbi:hypothetical protein HGM15179_016986, partial [Zosterops borbonicus]